MGLLKLGAALLAVTTACYSPELRDCTLTCNEAADCAADQVCGSDHFCAAPDIAGKCSSLPGDAGSNNRDAGTDSANIPDAATHAALTVSIEGHGQVTMTGIGTCASGAPQNGQCVFTVKLDSLITVSATSDADWNFDKWTTAACIGTPTATCTFTFNAATSLGVKFKKES